MLHQTLPKQISLNQIRALSTLKLIEFANKLDISLDNVLQKDMLNSVVLQSLKIGISVEIEGVLDIVNKYGFLRYESNNYVNTPEDVFINEQTIRHLGLRVGDFIRCNVKPSEGNNGNLTTDASLVRFVNGKAKEEAKIRPSFEKLTAIYPHHRIDFAKSESGSPSKEMRLINLFAPMGFGQRALIVAQPKTGKTTLMKQMAQVITREYKNAHVMILLISERPEEVRGAQVSVPGAIVLSSTFDEHPSKHIHVADLALERAKRLVEMGEDVVLFVDSLTRFARSNNCVIPSSNKVLTGGLDINALYKPKQFFGSARTLEEGGSLTIIATILVDTGTKTEEVIYEEFQGTSNCVIMLSREIAEARKYPALHLTKTGTREEAMLLTPLELTISNLLRASLSNLNASDALTRVMKRIEMTNDNEQLLRNSS